MAQRLIDRGHVPRHEDYEDTRLTRLEDRGHDPDLRTAVLSLGDDEREMIILRYYEGLTVKEAASRLGLSPSQAYRLHDKALAHLASLLDEGGARS